MGRPAKSMKPVPLNLSLDGDLAILLDEELFSELEQKVPHGAKSNLINKLLRTHFRSIKAKERHNASLAAADAPELKAKMDEELQSLMTEQSPLETGALRGISTLS